MCAVVESWGKCSDQTDKEICETAVIKSLVRYSERVCESAVTEDRPNPRGEAKRRKAELRHHGVSAAGDFFFVVVFFTVFA